MGPLTLGLFSKTHIASSLFSPTKTGSPVLKCSKLYIKLVVGTVRISTLTQSSGDCVTKKKTEHFKAITSNGHSSAIGEHDTSTGHNLKWDHFDI